MTARAAPTRARPTHRSVLAARGSFPAHGGELPVQRPDMRNRCCSALPTALWGLSFVHAHVARLIKRTGQQAIYLAGPGHGGPALVAAGYLEGTYNEVYPRVSQDEEVLSEHNCRGWLEGYTLTGRHSLFATYEAFAMVSAWQHGKWLVESRRPPWRAEVPRYQVVWRRPRAAPRARRCRHRSGHIPRPRHPAAATSLDGTGTTSVRASALRALPPVPAVRPSHDDRPKRAEGPALPCRMAADHRWRAP